MLAIFFIHPIHLLVMAVGLVLSLWASSRVKGAFAKWSQVRSRSGVTGAQVAQAILQANGIRDVQIEPVAGNLTDHYDPRTKTLRLSEPVYHSDSVAAVGVAAHEVGHAIQHAQNYGPLTFRSAWVPVASIGTNLGFLLLMIGLPLAYSGSSTLAWVGVLLYATTVVFTLVTLPVEFDASKRALATIEASGVLVADERQGAKQVLDAAALTYVAAAAVAMLELLAFVFRLLEAQRRD